MKLFRFRGGVHPEGHKLATGKQPIELLPMPKRLYIPVQQHIGAPAEPAVKPGHHVLKGRLLAHGQGTISAPVHAPTSGMIVDIVDHTAPHPSGLTVRTMILEADGKDEWMETDANVNPFELNPQEIVMRIGEAGVVGLGGATFPSAIKLKLGTSKPIKTLIINGGECEPYLTCDDRLMQERAHEVIDGVRILLHCLGAPRALIAIEDNKPEAIEAMKMAANLFEHVKVIPVPSPESRAVVKALNAAAANVSFVEIDSDRGHDAFLLDVPEMFSTIRGFLTGAAAARGIPAPGESA